MAVWAKIMTSLRDHPKAAEAGPQAMWLYVSMILYAKERDSQGHFPASQLSAKLHGKGAKRWADRLVSVGLVTETDDGWHVDKYEEKQGNAASIKDVRAQNTARKRRQREREKDDVTRDMSRTVTRSEQSREEQRREEEHTELATSLSTSTSSSSLTQATFKEQPAHDSDFAEAVEKLWLAWPSNRRPISAMRAAELLEAQGVTTADEVRTLIDRMREDSDSRDWREGVIPRLDNWITNRNWDRPAASKMDQLAKSEHPADRAVARFLEGAQ